MFSPPSPPNSKARAGRSVAEGKEYLTIFQHHPFQESFPDLRLLYNPNPNPKTGPLCNNTLAETMGTTCNSKKKTILPNLLQVQTDRRNSSSKRTRRKSTYLRLGKVESSEKIEYKVEVPIRAAVRMQYLMHNTNVLLNDPEFMNTVYDKLMDEESVGLHDSTEHRIKVEQDRVKALVIEGKMTPPPDMDYLYDHPVFKVTQMLKQLDQHDQALSMGPPIMEEITPVEPYEFDGDTFFKELHKNGLYWIPSVEMMAEEEKMAGKIARAKLRLMEKRYIEEQDDKIMYNKNSNEDFYDNDDTERDSRASITSDQGRKASKNLEMLRNEKERNLEYFRKRQSILEHQKETLNEKILGRQRLRDKIYLDANELERQAYIAKHNERMKIKEIPQVEFMKSEEKAVDKSTSGKRYKHLFDTPSTPPGVEETESFQNTRKYFEIRGNYYFEDFLPFNNPLIERYIDVVKVSEKVGYVIKKCMNICLQRVDEIVQGGNKVSDMYTREQLTMNDMMKELNRTII